jgi:intracellular sulfur oxidation DsrE/DsrF family protein
VFYGGPQGLGLVIKEGAKYVPNAQADIAKEVLSFLQAKHAYGEKITGKDIDQHFQGIGYGWERDMLRLVLAVLLRAGAIEVTYQGRRFRNHMDAQCRVPFANNTAFKSASFAPYESVDLKTLIAAVQALEELTGEEVDVEEGAISLALKKLAEEELKLLIPIEATARANYLPITSFLEDYHQTLMGIQSAASDDCVRTLAGEGESLESSRNRLHQIHAALTDAGLATIRQARQTATMVWPALIGRPEGEEIKDAADELQACLTSLDIDRQLSQLQSLTATITAVFEAAYTQLHNQRHDGYTKAIDVIRNRPEWESLPEGMGDSLLLPLTSRACQESADLTNTGIRCQACNATLSQMESDLAALQGLKVQVLARLQELTTPADQKQTRVERVRVSDFFGGVLDNDESINSAVERFREHLLKLIDEGAKIIVE